jgi:hypothetical protein
MNTRHWMQGTRITYQAPDTPVDPPTSEPAKGDPHGDEVLESGPDIPLVPDPPVADPPTAETPPTPDPETPPAPKPDWRDKELSRRKRRLDEEVTAKQALEAENKRLRDLAESLTRQTQPDPANPDPPAQQPRQPQQDPERRFTQAEVKAEAARIAADDAFKRDFNSAYEAGAKLAGRAQMDEAIGRISELGGLDYDHLQMVLATDDPGKVLYELGNKPEEFQRIMDLPFHRRVVEFTKMALKPETVARAPSKTPPPVEPIGGTGGGAGDHRFNDKMSDDEWFRREEAREAAEYKKVREKRGY